MPLTAKGSAARSEDTRVYRPGSRIRGRQSVTGSLGWENTKMSTARSARLEDAKTGAGNRAGAGAGTGVIPGQHLDWSRHQSHQTELYYQ